MRSSFLVLQASNTVLELFGAWWFEILVSWCPFCLLRQLRLQRVALGVLLAYRPWSDGNIYRKLGFLWMSPMYIHIYDFQQWLAVTILKLHAPVVRRGFPFACCGFGFVVVWSGLSCPLHDFRPLLACLVWFWVVLGRGPDLVPWTLSLLLSVLWPFCWCPTCSPTSSSHIFCPASSLPAWAYPPS